MRSPGFVAILQRMRSARFAAILRSAAADAMAWPTTDPGTRPSEWTSSRCFFRSCCRPRIDYTREMLLNLNRVGLKHSYDFVYVSGRSSLSDEAPTIKPLHGPPHNHSGYGFVIYTSKSGKACSVSLSLTVLAPKPRPPSRSASHRWLYVELGAPGTSPGPAAP